MPIETFKPQIPSSSVPNFEAIQNFQKSLSSVDSHAGGMPKMSGNIPPQVRELMDMANQGQPQPTSGLSVEQAAQAGISPQMAGMVGTTKLQELLAGAQKYTHKYEKITLPSLGRFYNGTDGPTDGVLNIRSMTGDEEDILANPRIARKGSALSEIFTRCLREKYNTDNFLQEDRYYLMIFLRGISLGVDWDAEMTCAVCSEKFPTTIDLDQDVQLTMCPDNFTAASLNEVLPVTGYKFTYRFPRISDELSIASYKSRKMQGFGNAAGTDTVTFKLSLYIQDIEGINDQVSIHTLIKNLPANDFNFIRDLVFTPPFGVNTKVKVQCPLCTSDFESDLPLDLSFFFPKGKKMTPLA